MSGGALIREARRRAGMTQRELAVRVGTTQSAIARIETGASDPRWGRVVEIVRACGLDLVPSVVEVDDSDWSVASGNLALGVDERVRRHQAALRFARAGREALTDARG